MVYSNKGYKTDNKKSSYYFVTHNTNATETWRLEHSEDITWTLQHISGPQILS